LGYPREWHRFIQGHDDNSPFFPSEESSMHFTWRALLKSCNSSVPRWPSKWRSSIVSSRPVLVCLVVRIVRIAHCSTCAIGAEIGTRQSFEKKESMNATETLEHEHRVIEQVASACGVCAEVLRGGTKVPADLHAWERRRQCKRIGRKERIEMATVSNVMIPTTNQARGVTITVAAEGIRLPRATSGPVLDLDLMKMSEQLRHEGAWSDRRNSRTLVKHGDFCVILTTMRAGARLHKHHARGTVLIQVLSGRIRARVLDESLEVPAGHALSLDPILEHEIDAVDESALLIMIGWPQNFDIVRKEPSAASRVRRLASLCSIADHFEAAARPESDAR
jgi:quercetin dioxygenase-like cupin family protein